MSPLVRNIFGQAQSTFDPRFTMNRRRILIANLSKGRLGEDKASLLGALLVSAFALAGRVPGEVRHGVCRCWLAECGGASLVGCPEAEALAGCVVHLALD